MIYCTLDGKKAYPATSENIKVTLENQYVKESGSYTYEISFPLAIQENLLVFGNVQRMDVRKSVKDFETCRLYANNRLVISGKGTVLSITNDTLKLQIIGGKSRIKYNSKFNKHYIDKIVKWENAELFEAFYNQTLSGLQPFGGHRTWSDNKDHGALKWDMKKYSFLGVEGKFSFNPILNTDTDIYSNLIMCFKQTDNTYDHIFMDLALQPWLMFTLERVLAAEGFTLERNDFNVYPWNRLVIANVEYTSTTNGMRKILPHMTVYDFLENVRKLLGGTFVFNEDSMKASFIKKHELSENSTAEYEAEDEFSCEHQDDGLESMETSNVKYDFDDTSEMDWRDVMSDDVLEQYDIKTYSSLTELNTAAAAMSANDRYRTIFCVDGDYYIFRGSSGDNASGGGGHFGGRRDSNDETSSSLDDEVYDGKIAAVGFFNPIIRNEDSDEYQELTIVPAAVDLEDKTLSNRSSREDYYRKHVVNVVKEPYKEWYILKKAANETVSDDSYTVYEAMLSGETDSNDNESTDDRLYLFFQSKFILDATNKKIVPVGTRKAETAYMPLVYTDYRQLDIFSKDSSFDEKMSLSFKALGLTDKASVTPINSHNEVTIKFLTDDIPDPTKIYIFRNKRYICSKIEINVKDDGIDKEKTGYFYEI